MRVLLIGADRTPAGLAEERLKTVEGIAVERMLRLAGQRPEAVERFDATLVWHELLEGLDRTSLRDFATLSRRMPVLALMSVGDWTGGRPGASLADGWVFLEVDLDFLPAIVRLAEVGYWTAPGDLIGERRDGLRRREAVQSLNLEQLKVLNQLAHGRTNRQIAERLSMPEPAVKKIVHTIINRLGLNNRTQAAIMALSMSRPPATCNGAGE